MDKTYDPQRIEPTWYAFWESQGFFQATDAGDPYCIMIPPPNVTGSLHMGHGFNNTIMDALIRWRRMQGRSALWQVGTDHAGIATQMVVERQLAAEGQQREDLGRQGFLEKVWAWKAESGGTITRQLRRLGSSVDWSRERFTMDEGLSQAVREAFVQLHEAGLIYRGQRLVNWDPVLHTAISDLEVQSVEEKGSLWHFRYPLADGSGALVVATTRPETMLGDTAVAVHPDDERYRHLIGQTLRLPLVGREIPIVGDAYVDPEFGTGCVKITPAHDFNDYEVGRRQGLPLINVLDRHGRILDPFVCYSADGSRNPEGIAAPPELAGLDRFAARERIVEALAAEGSVVAIEPHALKVPRGDRSGVVIEPWLTEQWYVDAKALAGPAIEAVESGRIRFVPQQYENLYFSWMRDIQDWCISRQLWWGHRIPAWYDDQGQVYVGRSEEAVRQSSGLSPTESLRQDEDVLDTWFSSALWTFSTLGWPSKTPELARFHPTDVLVTGFDIIFFWVARMVMMTLHFMKNPDGSSQVPFKTVYVHGLVRDAEGQKMSKSKGNVLDPLDIIDGITLDALIEKRTRGLMQPQMATKIAARTRKEFPEGIAAYGCDALRFTFASLASTGRDIKFDLGRVEGYRNFCNKLWNAARFVLMHTEGVPMGEVLPELGLAERWIRSRLDRAITETTQHLEEFRFDLASRSLYDFAWNEYCDWYLEFAKVTLQGEDPALREGSRQTLVFVLENILRLIHPLMPFITEEIWQRVAPLAGRQGATIMMQPYPLSLPNAHDAGSEAVIAWVQSFLLAVRRIRGEMNIPPGKPLEILLEGGSEIDRDYWAQSGEALCRLGRINRVDWLAPEQSAPESAIALLGDLKILIPMRGLIDKDAELARLSKEVERVAGELPRLEAKLSDAHFVERAPAEVVAKEQQRLDELKARLGELKAQQQRIGSI